MSDVWKQLEQYYCYEFQQRMQRALIITHRQGYPSAGDLDDLHQEFDSLRGAARAIHQPVIEEFNAHMAAYTRDLRNSLPKLITDDEKKILQDAININLGCKDVICDCESDCEKQMVLLKQDRIKQMELFSKQYFDKN